MEKCPKCSTSLGTVHVPEHFSSDSLKLSHLLNSGSSASGNTSIVVLEGPFADLYDIEPLIALGYIFVFSRSGHINVLNLCSLEEASHGANAKPMLSEVRSNPILIRQTEAKKVGKKKAAKETNKNLLCVALEEEIALLSIEYGSKKDPIVIRDMKRWSLNGEPLTDPVYMMDNIIIGTDQGISAYDIYGAKTWDYSGAGVLEREKIATPLFTDGEKIFFGSHGASSGHIHCLYADSGLPAWDALYAVHASVIGDIHLDAGFERLIFYDRDGRLHNLDVNGDSHFPSRGNTTSDLPSTGCWKDEYLYVATAAGEIHCLDSFGDMARLPYKPNRPFFFHSRPVLGSDFVVFTADDGSLFFVGTDSSRVLDVKTVWGEYLLNDKPRVSPIMTIGYLYLLSESGYLVRIGGGPDGSLGKDA